METLCTTKNGQWETYDGSWGISNFWWKGVRLKLSPFKNSDTVKWLLFCKVNMKNWLIVASSRHLKYLSIPNIYIIFRFLIYGIDKIVEHILFDRNSENLHIGQFDINIETKIHISNLGFHFNRKSASLIF